MAAPKNNRSKLGDPLYEATRARIQTTQLIKRLTNHGLGTKDDQGRAVVLDSSQVQAIKILLDKSIPNLQATELTVPDGINLHHNLSDEDLAKRISKLNKEQTDAGKSSQAR